MNQATKQQSDDTALSLREQQEKKTESLGKLLPANVDESRFQAFAIAILRDPKLAECTEQSKLIALSDCAKLGLYPDRNLGHVWLVPFKRTVQLIPGYQGYIELARRSGAVRTVHTGIVYEADMDGEAFRVWTDDAGRHIHHEPKDPFALEGDLGKKVGVYCIATLSDGSRQIETMNWMDVMSVRGRSKAAHSGPWVTDENAMARKTIVRRARKYWPQSPELAALGAYDDTIDGAVVESDNLKSGDTVPPTGLDDLMDDSQENADAEPPPEACDDDSPFTPGEALDDAPFSDEEEEAAENRKQQLLDEAEFSESAARDAEET